MRRRPRTLAQQQHFAAVLRQRRQALGLSPAEVAARAGLRPAVVRDYEQRTTQTPRRATLAALAGALELPFPTVFELALGQPVLAGHPDGRPAGQAQEVMPGLPGTS